MKKALLTIILASSISALPIASYALSCPDADTVQAQLRSGISHWTFSTVGFSTPWTIVPPDQSIWALPVIGLIGADIRTHQDKDLRLACQYRLGTGNNTLLVVNDSSAFYKAQNPQDTRWISNHTWTTYGTPVAASECQFDLDTSTTLHAN